MLNFTFLNTEPKFKDFADLAGFAEEILEKNPAISVANARVALEACIKWMYEADNRLIIEYDDDKLSALIFNASFKKLIGDLLVQVNFIRKSGNIANHNPKAVTYDNAKLTLYYLEQFLRFVYVEYADEPVSFEEQAPDMSEAETRKVYIDIMLADAGWERGKDWQDEYKIDEMPNKSGFGFADYVLFSDNGKPLAVVESKRTSISVEEGRHQATLYADFLEKKFGQRPIIFLTNGFETKIIDNSYHERPVSTIYAKMDLEKAFNKARSKNPLSHIIINDEIVDRPYQYAAIKSVCEDFNIKNRRKALLVMATGSGKTRTIIALIDVLLNNGWIKNILFLADRRSLVRQAKRSFNALLPDLSLCNLMDDKDDPNARCVFSTYQTMINCIDSTFDENNKKLFTSGHFDIIICDEAHRSIYNKYKDIFTYFDALLVGLTATPKADIDKNTYNTFELADGMPTYGYELSDAVADGFLNDFMSIETSMKFLEEGISYDELSEDEKEEYEETFVNEDGDVPETIGSSALNEWIFNKDTIRQVLSILMTDGIKVEYGTKIGKTIIFAKKHTHAEAILKVWNEEYPNYPSGYAQVIDNKINYAEDLIDKFSQKNSFPQIAISVDMLDTGIDIPEIVNLVFFKKVLSKSKFWQMIGRGTRLCHGLIDGKDKGKFFIFDFCGNFEFFRINKVGIESTTAVALHERIFNLKIEIIYKLQDFKFQTEDLKVFRKSLVEECIQKITEINKENFAVRQHLRYIDSFMNVTSFQAVEFKDTQDIAIHVAPYILPKDEEVTAVRFDALMYQIESAYLKGNTASRFRNDLHEKALALTRYGTIPQIEKNTDFIHDILMGDYLANAGINEFEKIRETLRDLMIFIQQEKGSIYTTNFTDQILAKETNTGYHNSDDLKNYKDRANQYIHKNESKTAIYKLKNNISLNPTDIKELEEILWSEVGTRNDYEKEIGEKPLGQFVREIVGLDKNAANLAFAKYLTSGNLNSKQIHFVGQIVTYIVQNGLMPDLRVLGDAPFTNGESISAIFDDASLFEEIKNVIFTINKNAMVA